MRKISFCITTFNRFDSVVKIINAISPHVDEVVISDDHSDIKIFNKLNISSLTIPLYLGNLGIIAKKSC